MQIVIEIDEERYSDVKNQVKNGIDNPLKVIIASGIPLPKNHGRLIDADEAEKVMMDVMCGTGYQSDAMRVLKSDFYTPTVIEADGGAE